MYLNKISFENFGPFPDYIIPFPNMKRMILLLTGKNNEGKSFIIFAIRLLQAALKVIGENRYGVDIGGDLYYRLLRQDVGYLIPGRLVHNYYDSIGIIKAEFSDGFIITVFINPKINSIYADHYGQASYKHSQIFGFIPPLGPLAEEEEVLGLPHIKNSIDSSLAPRHLRNHFHQIITKTEFKLISEIIQSSWKGIKLSKVEYDISSNQLSCFYKEYGIDREISWAGQGLQVWFQIITHMVRQRNQSILILDEPEINLHPEKQNDLVRILSDNFNGSIIIATHSVELMNNVDISHIIHVQKKSSSPIIKSTSDRSFLDQTRSSIGSNFNLIASQFEQVSSIIFTEDRSDYVIIKEIANLMNIKTTTFNIPLSGFSEYRKAIYYKKAYEHFIGSNKTTFTVVLDRDYYPPKYLKKIISQLCKANIDCVFTHGKEIENIFLAPSIIKYIIEPKYIKQWKELWDSLCESEYDEIISTATKLYKEFSGKFKLDLKSVSKKVLKNYNTKWKNKNERYMLISGKTGLKSLRIFYQQIYGKSLTQAMLIKLIFNHINSDTKTFINEIFS